MKTALRESGSELLGPLLWGTHLCQFYESRQDLLDILIPYFAAGLKNNEFCMWITSAPLEPVEAERALSEAVPDFAECKRRGQIEILSYDQWYTKSGRFDADAVLKGWLEKEAWALANGYEGLRMTGNTSWLAGQNLGAFLDYERMVDSVVGGHRVLVVCTYFLEKCALPDIIEVIDAHEFALVKNRGAWRKVAGGRRRAEDALRFNSEIFKNMTEGISLVGMGDGLIKYANPRFEKMLGYEAGELEGKDVSVVNSPAARQPEETKKEIIGILNRTGEWHGEIENIRKDGTRLWCYANVSLFEHERFGRVCINVHTDITGHKRTEETLKESEARYRVLFEQARDSILLLEIVPDGLPVILDANSEALRLHGYTREELIGKPVTFLDTDTPAAVMAERAKQSRAAGGTLFEAQHRHKDGSVFDLEVSLVKIGYGGKPLLLDISRDITERKKAEGAAAKEREQFKAILSSLPYGVYIVDKECEIQYVNPVVEKSFGPVSGRKCYKYFHERETPCPWCVNTEVFAGKSVSWEWRSEKTGRTYDLFDTPLRNPDGKIFKLEFLNDITERVTAVEALKKNYLELKAEKKLLADKNVAFRELIKEIEVEKNALKDEITINVNKIIMPILKRIKLKSGTSRKQLDLLEKSLGTLISSFGRKLTETNLKLTPKEIEICNMVKSGQTTKEMAGLLNASPMTIDKHRNNIRKKLGLSKKGVNLTTFLQSL